MAERTPVHAFPLSWNQQQVWLHEQMDELGAAYHVTIAHRLHGPLQPSAISAAVQALVDRHEALRTVFRAVAGTPRQVVLPHVDIHVDQAVAPSAAGQPLANLLAEHASRPFDLAGGPLLRVLLVRVAAAEHVLALTLHHLVTDGWSTGVLRAELRDAYVAFAAGRAPVVEPVRLHYPDYTLWQRDRYDEKGFAGELAFWRSALDGVPQHLDLPFDRPRSALRAHASGELPFTVPADLVTALGHLAKQQGATLFMGLFAVFAALLGRYTGQERFTIGTPVLGRDWPEFDATVGLFATMLPVPVDLRGGPGLATLVQRTRTALLGTLSHSHAPFDRIVAELVPSRSAGTNPYLQIACQLWHDDPPAVAEVAGVTFEPLPVSARQSPFELELVAAGGSPLRCGLAWATALFDGETIRRCRDHLLALLAGGVREPDAPVWRLPMLTEREVAELLGIWARPAPDKDLTC